MERREGRTDGWTDGGTDGRTDGWADGRTAEANPANHSGSMVRLLKIGLGFGIISWKAACKLLDKPKFIEALIATILCKPEIVKCSLFKIRLRTSLKSM